MIIKGDIFHPPKTKLPYYARRFLSRVFVYLQEEPAAAHRRPQFDSPPIKKIELEVHYDRNQSPGILPGML